MFTNPFWNNAPPFSAIKLDQFDMRYMGAGTGPGPVRTLTGPKIGTGPADRAISESMSSFSRAFLSKFANNFLAESRLTLMKPMVQVMSKNHIITVRCQYINSHFSIPNPNQTLAMFFLTSWESPNRCSFPTVQNRSHPRRGFGIAASARRRKGCSRADPLPTPAPLDGMDGS